MSPLKRLLNLVLAPLLIVGAVLMVKKQIDSRKTPPSRIPPIAVPAVPVIIAQPGTHTAEIQTFGNVRAYHQATLASRVSGEILKIAPEFEVGRPVNADQLLLTIDPADFETTLSERKAAVAAAEQVLAEEKARSQLAVEDWLSTDRSLDQAPDFTLRKPQLASAEANLDAAIAAVDRARLDLDRTKVKAPFDAIVGTRTTSPGNIIAAGTELGTLIARHRVDVRLPLTPEQATLIQLPIAFNENVTDQTLSTTLVTPTRPGKSWSADITRTEAGVDQRNQVLYVIAEVKDPFLSPDSFLPIGAFVEATIPARPAANTYQLPESALIEDRYVWTVDDDNNLARQPISRLSSRNGSFIGSIPDDTAALVPMKVVTRPLVSFGEGTEVKPITSAPQEVSP